MELAYKQAAIFTATATNVIHNATFLHLHITKEQS
jgi:hypothetical protein